jgi:HEPN domain-containing protein
VTPLELRQNGWGKLQSAIKLFEETRYDDASYLAGYAVEMALKARYCTRNPSAG